MVQSAQFGLPASAIEKWDLLTLLATMAGFLVLVLLARQLTRKRGSDGKQLSLAPIDTVLPRQPRFFLAFVVAVALGCWVVGFALATRKKDFLATPEWLVQPFYIAAHFIALRMFINIYTLNFRSGVLHLDVPFAQSVRGVRLILGPAGVLVALLIAIPFCVSDYNYLISDRYVKMGEDNMVRPIDYELWGIWCLEWFLNSLMWVILIGFLFKNCSTIRSHAFRSPIDVVLREKHYKPFLQMSAQGATIVLGFSACTLTYMLLTGGEITDYLGLGITSSLLVVGFVPPWIILNSKVDRAVRSAMTDLRQSLPQRGLPTDGRLDAHSAADPLSLEHRLDEVLALLRLSHLENLYRTLGQSEAKAIVFRLSAPAATAVWQLSQNSAYIEKLGRALHAVLGRFLS